MHGVTIRQIEPGDVIPATNFEIARLFIGASSSGWGRRGRIITSTRLAMATLL